MNAKRFPRGPQITPRPFDGGPNPFSDGQQPTEPLPDKSNFYQTTTNESVQPYRPVEYETTLPDRSGKVLRFGIFGAVFSGLTVLIAIIVIVTVEWTEGMIYCVPMGLVGLSFAMPAWAMGNADLRAIKAGAMDKRGEQATRIGRWLGCASTIIGVIPSLGGIAAIVASIFL